MSVEDAPRDYFNQTNIRSEWSEYAAILSDHKHINPTGLSHIYSTPPRMRKYIRDAQANEMQAFSNLYNGCPSSIFN